MKEQILYEKGLSRLKRDVSHILDNSILKLSEEKKKGLFKDLKLKEADERRKQLEEKMNKEMSLGK